MKKEVKKMEWWNNIDCSPLASTKSKDDDSKYISLVAAFDIETSTVAIDDGNKISYMYIWQMAIEDITFYGRTWEDFRRCLKKIKTELKLDAKYRLLVYVHNLKSDFSFLKSEVNVSGGRDFIARSPHDVIKCIVNDAYEFRDSYCYTEKPLEDMGREIGLPKVTGYDYTKIRHSETPLNKKELEYCETDVKILVEYFRREKNKYGSLANIPLTATQRVKKVLWKYYRDVGSKSEAKGRKLKDNKHDKAMLKQLRSAYWGAINFCNPLYIGYTTDNAISVDLDCAYGSLALRKKYPMYKFKLMEKNPDNPRDLINDKSSYIITLRLTKLKNKYPNIGFLPTFKLRHWDYDITDLVSDEGKILSTAWAIITITEVDLELLYEFYEWENLEIISVLEAKKSYLPDYIRLSIVELYQNKKKTKEQLKKIQQTRAATAYEELNYINVKSMISRIYGVFVQDPEPDVYRYDPASNLIGSSGKSKLSSASDLTAYQWGVWITAYCRYEMLMLLKKIAVRANHGKEKYDTDTLLYIDTDCIKCKNITTVNNIITQYNNDVKKYFKEFCTMYGISYKSIAGIGELDREDYQQIKMLGQKKYAYIDAKGRFVSKISGLSRKNTLFDGKTPQECMDLLSLDMDIPSDVAKNTECKYVTYDDHKKFLIIDYLGDSAEISLKSFAVINNIGYKSDVPPSEKLKYLNPDKIKKVMGRR